MDRSHLAAAQRATVAHGASHGFGQMHISKAPDGAAENRFEMRLNLPPRFSGSVLFHPAIRFVQGLFNHPQNKKEPGFFNPGS